MEVVNNMSPFEPEVKEKFKEIDNRIDNVEDKVDGIEDKVTRMEVKLETIDQSQARIENTVLQGHNLILTTLQTFIANNTQKEIAQDKNKTDLQITKENNRVGLYDKTLTFVGKLLVLVAAFFSGKNLGEISNWIKDLFK